MVATGHLVVVVRAGISGQDWSNGLPGLSVGNLTLDSENTLDNKDWLEVIGENFAVMLDSVTDIALGLVALALFLSQRRHRE